MYLALLDPMLCLALLPIDGPALSLLDGMQVDPELASTEPQKLEYMLLLEL